MTEPITPTNEPVTPAPTPVEPSNSPVNTLETEVKDHKGLVIGLVLLLIVSFILNGIFGYSYKKTIKDYQTSLQTIQTLQEQINTQSNETITQKPMLLGGKIAYETVTRKSKKTSTTENSTSNSLATTKLHQETVIEKDMATFALGKNLNGDFEIDGQRNLLDTPFGNLGISLQWDINSFKYSSAFITYQL
jgi:hypothetical protein